MPRIGIIGSGFGATAVAAEFLRHGYSDVRLWERSTAIGGVWRDNTYPGAACDVPSPFYSFSFAPSKLWPRRYAEQPDILAYLRAVAEREGVTSRTRLSTEVRGAQWSGTVWNVRFADGTHEEVDVLVSAVGQLSNPVIPAIPGAQSFQGPAFHSAQWPAGLDLTGRRVSVIGAAATAVQAVPQLAPSPNASRCINAPRTTSGPNPMAATPSGTGRSPPGLNARSSSGSANNSPGPLRTAHSPLA